MRRQLATLYKTQVGYASGDESAYDTGGCCMYIDTSTVTICASGDECNDDEAEVITGKRFLLNGANDFNVFTGYAVNQ